MSAAVVGGRYVLGRSVGRGGMALVYDALDTATGRRVALKQLSPHGQDRPLSRCVELFEREYHTLSELSHPRIVAAIDYGRDADQPYYTMELLDGGDLMERSPLPWREACAVARDICSALSLVHSRRMVYRDLSPRNVRCTSDGKAKLLDFGAMAPMGSARSAVCTPSVASPEVVYRLPLDGRSDLYALGAMLYFTLVGRSAYPARDFQQLMELWKQSPPPPSEFDPEIPAALDALVMELMQLDPQVRPASAAEVSQRLSAIAGLSTDEHLLVANAYLTTPTLVGRERELAVISSMLERIRQHGQGAALLVRGAPGMGRSRLLDSSVLSAKLAGLTAVRLSPGISAGEPLALAQELTAQLLDIAKDDVLEAAYPYRGLLLECLPALRERLSGAPVPDDSAPANDRKAHVQSTLRAFLLEVARRRPLLLAVDDVERFDPDSRALVTLLAHRASGHPLLLLCANAGDGCEDDSTRLLADACLHLSLKPLDREHTRALLASIFGDVPNLSGLVLRLHELSSGRPQYLMRLAQHLVDRGMIRYEDFAWVLPERIDGTELPETMAQAFHAKVASLDADARALGQAFGEWPDQRFTFEECLALTAHRDAARTLRSLDRLLSADVVALRGDGYALSSKSWIAALAENLDPELHVRLARVFELRGDGLRAARHLFRGGRELEGVERLIAFARDSYERTSASIDAYVKLLSSLPHDWREILETGMALCRKQGRPAKDLRILQVRVGSLVSQHDVCSDGHLSGLAQSIARDAGLDIYAELDPKLPAGERLQRALSGAAARYQAAEEHERVLDPKAAIALLARTMITAIGNFSRTLDVEEWYKMPSLEPLAPLSPAVAAAHQLARGFEARMSGRFEEACEIYRETLELLDDDKGTTLDHSFVEGMRGGLPSILGMMEAVLGLPSSERHAAAVGALPLYEGSAMAIRMLYALWQGDVAGADRLARERELWRLEQPRKQVSDVLTVLWALQAHAASDDLTHTRHDLEAIERIASQLRTWQPVAAWARGEYERIRGDHAAALTALDAALAALPTGRHQVWPLCAGARVRVLYDLRRFAEAREAGEAYLALAREHGLGYLENYVRMPLALASAKLGDGEAAFTHAREVIASFEALGARGLNLGLAYETAARVAAYLGDAETLRHYKELCKQHLLAHPNPALAAKYERVNRTARRTRLVMLENPAEESFASTLQRTQMQSLLETCATVQDRLERVLDWIVSGSGAEYGYLYGMVDGVPTLRAATGDRRPPPEIHAAALRQLERELSGFDEETKPDDTGQAASEPWTAELGRCYRPVLLGHAGPEGFVVSGLALLGFECGRALRPVADIVSHVSRIVTEIGDLPAHTVAR